MSRDVLRNFSPLRKGRGRPDKFENLHSNIRLFLTGKSFDKAHSDTYVTIIIQAFEFIVITVHFYFMYTYKVVF